MPFFLVSFFVFFSASSFALPIEKLTDVLLSGGGGIEYQKKQLGAAHQILLSAPKRINNELFVERDKRIGGELNVSLLHLSSATPLSDVYRTVEKMFGENGTVEYQCQQRACGVSSYWANNIFDEKRLSGRDSDQYYIAGSVNDSGSEYWLSVYIVSNALRQHLIYISYITKSSESASWSNGYLLPKSYELPEEIQLTLTKKLQGQPELDLYVAAYVDGKKINSVKKMNSVISSLYQAVENKLSKSLGVTADKVHLQFVGAFHEQVLSDEPQVWFRLFLYSP